MATNYSQNSGDPLARGGVRRYLDSVPPTDFLPPHGDIKLDTVSLGGLADFYGTDKGSIKHGYTTVYENLISELTQLVPRTSAALSVTEIGVACGASLRMWADYLPGSTIFGYDIRPACKSICQDKKNIQITIADLTKIPPENSSHLLIDDGSHISEDIVAAFINCWPSVLPGGYYVIEDLSCTYNSNYTLQFEALFRRKVENKRNSVLEFIDILMRSIDSREDIAEFRYHPQLLVIKKIK
jgi:trans-aconitate methyltransferase